MNLKRWLGIEPQSTEPRPAGETEALCERVRDLEERLRSSEAILRDRSETLYEIQRQYSTEHFELTQSMRNLKIERMRNAGAHAAQDIVVGRYRRLQVRIEELKQRLRKYETVEDLYEDTAPVVLDEDSQGT